MSHRKTVKHYESERGMHELTFSCYRRMPLLTNDLWRASLAESISVATELYKYDLLAFVFMPEHVHLLVLPRTDEPGISNLLKAIKRPHASRVKQWLQSSNGTLLHKLTVRQRPGVTTFRYWQEGPGYDRNLDNARSITAAIDYIHRNPVRRGLVARTVDWRWSSARHYSELSLDPEPSGPRLDPIPPGLLD